MACVACHNAKRKCSYSNGQNKCDRCTKHDIDCDERQSNQGQRTDLLNKRDRSPFDDSDSDVDDDSKAKRICTYPQVQDKCVSCIKHTLSSGVDISCSICCGDSISNCSMRNVNSKHGMESEGTVKSYCTDTNPLYLTAESSDEMDIHILPADMDDNTPLSEVPSDAHELHRGIDLSSNDINGEICHDFDPNNKVTRVTTYTRGGRSFFVVGDSTDLIQVFVKNRVKIPNRGRVTFIQSTCLVGLGNSCVGCEAVIQLTPHSPWKYAIIQGLFDKCIDGIDILKYFEWNGTVDQDGCPVCFKMKTWAEMKSHFILKEVRCSDVHDFHFVNQVRGEVPLNGSILPNTKNDIDGGVQCSLNGPGCLEIPLPKFNRTLGIPLKDHALSENQTGYKNLLVPNKSLKKNRNKIMSSIPADEDEDVRKFYLPSKLIPAHDQLGLVVVVTNQPNEPITPQQAKCIPSQLTSTLNFPSLVSASDTSSPKQKYYCLSEVDHTKLCIEYDDGLSVRKNYEEEVDRVLSSYSTNDIELLSLDKISRMVPRNQDKTYHDFVRIFGGDGSPPVDESFQLFKVDSLEIYCKYVDARTYCEYVPLSIGFFHSPFHQLQIQPSFISKIQVVLGNLGTYHNRASVVVPTKSHQSYLGERKSDKLNQPTVSEGPTRYDETSNDHNYSYYRQRIGQCALKWPFVIGLMNLLVASTSIAPYYFYPHLACLFTKRNNSRWHMRFCSVVIVTISFCCSCHEDKNDLQKWAVNEMIEKLKKISKRFGELKVPYASKIMAASQSLKHVIYWGVSVPTTCCYQYIKERNDIEVYQMFMCPGLGTSYRIKNYWVHIMLASLFSHCTSDAVYIVDGKAYFGKCPGIKMFAWGAN